MEYTILRSRRKTIAIQITPAGQVIVRCPAGTSKQEIRRFVAAKAPWIQSHLSRISEAPPLPVCTGEELDTMTRWLKQALPERVDFWASKIGVTYGRITVRRQHTRWGSCSSRGNLNFNCLLTLVPEEVLDYVIVHELCHRKHMNHSPAFWAEVSQFLPDYAIQKQWLKTEGIKLMARLPTS